MEEIIRVDHKRIEWGMQTSLTWLRIGRSGGLFEHGIEMKGSIEGGPFLIASQRLCSF
jgi:hypothetical protein